MHLVNRVSAGGLFALTSCEHHSAESELNTGTIDSMLLAIFAIRVLELMFFVGLAGSAVVVLISFFEDAKELVGDE
jgi:hypothetical protein